MGAKKKYSAAVNYEQKLKTVMERLGVEKYDYDWTRRDCYVEMIYHGRAYRFDNSFDKVRKTGRSLAYISDIFAEVVLSLEGLARATEKGILELDMLLTGVPSLPAHELPACFEAMGFEELPTAAADVERQYKAMAKLLHPDAGGDDGAFVALQEARVECQRWLEGAVR